MAVRKTSTRRTVKKPPLKSAKGAGNRMPVSVVFRIFLLIVIIIAFFMLLPVIKNLRQNAKAVETEQGTGEDEGKAREEVTDNREQVTEGKKPQTEKPAAPEQKEPEKKPAAEKPAVPEQPEKKPQTEKSATPAQPSTPPAPVSAPPVKPSETRGSIYLIQESNKMLVKVNRNLNANTPLTDSINALLAGPTPDEIMRGIESFVPEGSRLIKPPAIKGSTVELDFNQEFRYNTRGSEGCATQIKQIVWTATEFPNVQNVQFFIEGQKVDFLSEGVMIRNPIGR